MRIGERGRGGKEGRRGVEEWKKKEAIDFIFGGWGGVECYMVGSG